MVPPASRAPAARKRLRHGHSSPGDEPGSPRGHCVRLPAHVLPPTRSGLDADHDTVAVRSDGCTAPIGEDRLGPVESVDLNDRALSSHEQGATVECPSGYAIIGAVVAVALARGGFGMTPISVADSTARSRR